MDKEEKEIVRQRRDEAIAFVTAEMAGRKYQGTRHERMGGRKGKGQTR